MNEIYIRKAIKVYDSLGQEFTLISVSPELSELHVNGRMLMKISKEDVKHLGRMFDQFHRDGF